MKKVESNFFFFFLEINAEIQGKGVQLLPRCFFKKKMKINDDKRNRTWKETVIVLHKPRFAPIKNK